MKKKPVIFLIDDDPAVLNSIVRDIRSEYKTNYRVMATQSANEALEVLRDLKNRGEVVALFISDQRMPDMLGVDFLVRAKEFYPNAKRVLLTAYSDTQAAIKAINDVHLDYYLLKPWDPPEEKIYPVINDQLDEWESSYIPDFQGIKIVGYQWSPKSHEIKDFLSGNLVPFQWMDILNHEEAADLIKINNIDNKDLPAVFFEDGSYLLNPSTSQVGAKTGMTFQARQTTYDVAIIGAGPAGLAASVYGGSEGLSTVLIEKRAPGGQAGTSSRIENYLGFPNGLSGAELSRRAITQATRFGIEFLSPQEVKSIDIKDQYKLLQLADGSTINARSVIITCGVDYQRHPARGIDKFTGSGIYYGAATTEANACRGQDVFIIGGGNSAGQAAMYLSKFAGNVNIVIRRPDLTSSMSQYLVEQISHMQNIHIMGCMEIEEVKGNERLEEITLKNNRTGEILNRPAAALFIFIGARPMTDWININVIKDEKGFIETGSSLLKYDGYKRNWKLKRTPFLLETCVPGVFAAGDVRSGAMNRVASAVGEGSMAIKFVHEYLAEN